MQTAKRHMQRYSTSLIFREMQIKTSMSISSHRSEQSSSKNLQITNAQEGVGKKEHSYTTGKCKLIHPLWRTVLKLLKKKKKTKNITTIAKRKC